MSKLSEVVKKYDIVSATCYMGIATKCMRDDPKADASMVSAMELATTIMMILTETAVTRDLQDLVDAIQMEI